MQSVEAARDNQGDNFAIRKLLPNLCIENCFIVCRFFFVAIFMFVAIVRY